MSPRRTPRQSALLYVASCHTSIHLRISPLAPSRSVPKGHPAGVVPVATSLVSPAGSAPKLRLGGPPLAVLTEEAGRSDEPSVPPPLATGDEMREGGGSRASDSP